MNYSPLQDNRDIAEKRLKSSLQRDCDKKIYLTTTRPSRVGT